MPLSIWSVLMAAVRLLSLPVPAARNPHVAGKHLTVGGRDATHGHLLWFSGQVSPCPAKVPFTHWHMVIREKGPPTHSSSWRPPRQPARVRAGLVTQPGGHGCWHRAHFTVAAVVAAISAGEKTRLMPPKGCLLSRGPGSIFSPTTGGSGGAVLPTSPSLGSLSHDRPRSSTFAASRP